MIWQQIVLQASSREGFIAKLAEINQCCNDA